MIRYRLVFVALCWCQPDVRVLPQGNSLSVEAADVPTMGVSPRFKPFSQRKREGLDESDSLLSDSQALEESDLLQEK